MKKNGLHIALEVLKVVFFAVLPLVIFLYKCTTIYDVDGGSKFITGCSGYIVALIVFAVFKKVLCANYLKDLSSKIVNYETQLETETDKSKIPLIEKALRKCSLIRVLFTTAPIILIALLILALVKAIETDLITLYNALGLICFSYLLGLIVSLIQAATIKSKNRS